MYNCTRGPEGGSVKTVHIVPAEMFSDFIEVAELISTEATQLSIWLRSPGDNIKV